MVSKIISIIWIAVGIFWLIKPAALQNFFKKKISKKIRRGLFAFALLVGLYFIGLALKGEGLFAKIFFVLGIIVVVKAFLILKSKIIEKWAGWISGKPRYLFRICAMVYILIGILLFSRK